MDLMSQPGKLTAVTAFRRPWREDSMGGEMDHLLRGLDGLRAGADSVDVSVS